MGWMSRQKLEVTLDLGLGDGSSGVECVRSPCHNGGGGWTRARARKLGYIIVSAIVLAYLCLSQCMGVVVRRG